jgi:hypothetical protein
MSYLQLLSVKKYTAEICCVVVYWMLQRLRMFPYLVDTISGEQIAVVFACLLLHDIML